MKIEIFINNEAKKYKAKAIKIKQNGVNLDKLEKLAWQHTQNCIEFIEAQNIYSYAKECDYKNSARSAIQKIDDELFGCFNDRGVCIGYNYYNV